MNTTSAPAPARRRVRVTKWRVALYGFLALLVAGTIAYIRLTDPVRVAEIARETLARMTGSEVRIQGAAFELNGTIRLFGVDIRVPRVPGSPAHGDRLFTADQILITHNVWSLATGNLDIQSISLIRPTFFPTEDVDNNKFTFQYLKPKSQTTKHPSGPKVVDLPDIHLSQALIVFGEIEKGQYRAIETVQLNGDLTRQPSESGAYSFALRQTRGDLTFVLSGDFDLYKETMAARMQLGSLTPNDRRIAILPRQVRTLFQRLKPTGAFPSIQFGFDAERRFHATVQIADGGVSIPWGQTELFVENSRGEVTIEQNDRLTIDLKGRARGSNYGADYAIKGEVHGFEDSAAFDVDVQLAGLLPDQPQDLELLPREMRTLIEQFAPRGRFDIGLNLQRDGGSGMLLTSGQVRLIDASITAAQFKYPLDSVNGTIRFDNEQIEIVGLTGLSQPDEFGRRGKIAIKGQVIGTGRRPGVHIAITAEGAPVDQTWLYGALHPEREQPIFDMFFDRNQYLRLADEKTGVVQGATQRAQRLEQIDKLSESKRELEQASPRDADAIAAATAQVAALKKLAERPVFDFGGVADAQIDIRLDPGERKQRTTIRAKSPGLRIAYEHWPYPLTIINGELVINLPAVDGEAVRVSGSAKGLNGGLVAIDGVLRPPTDSQKNRNLVPDLRLTATGIPIDETLLGSLPAADAKIVRDLQIAGNIDVDGKITNDANDRIDFRIGVAMAGGKARPNGGRYELEGVDARILIHKRGVDIQSVTARHGQSTLAIHSAPDGNGKPESLVLTGKRMRFTDPLLDLIPGEEKATSQIKALLRDYEPDGEFDFTLGNLRRIDDGGTDYLFTLTPRDAKVTLRGQRVDVTGMLGSVEVSPKRVVMKNLSGDFGTGRFSVSGEIGPGSRPIYDLIFDVEASSYCKVTRVLLPEGALSAIDSLKLEGGYRIRGARLVVDPAAVDRPTLKFDATVRLDDAKAMVGVPLKHMAGDVLVKITEYKQGEPPVIDLQLDGVRLRASERLVDPVSVRITSGDKPGYFHISKLKGQMYGGTITGSGLIYRQDKTDRYKMEVALQEVALDAFLHPADPNPPAADAPRQGAGVRLIGDATGPDGGDPRRPRNEPVIRKRAGLLSASLAIEGDTHDADTKRGRGDLRIRNAALFETQLGVAMLQLLNLSAPVSKSFDKVQATYILDGDLVHLDRIHFEAPTLTISGSGKMKYSTLDLDLSMTTANPRGIELGPLGDVLKMLRDELVSIRVRGTLTDPKASVQSLKGVTGVVDEVLGKPKEPKRPVPPARE